jgi:uncharacterized coiled-coil DUF342 family protein
MESEEEVKSRIDELEKEKGGLIERIKKLIRRVRYKKYEKKALEPFLEKTKNVRIAPLRKRKKALEFRISTSAYTPRIERDLLKEVRKLEEQLEELKEVERSRRKKRYVEQDIVEGEAEIQEIEVKLNEIRGELRKLYDSMRDMKRTARKTAAAKERMEEDMVALGDLAMMEEDKNQPS